VAGAIRACAHAEPYWAGFYRPELSAGVAKLVLVAFGDGPAPGEIVVSRQVFEALTG
jgi:hypothetical protein